MSRFKVGDKVRVKSLDWYNEYKDKHGNIRVIGKPDFVPSMTKFLGEVLVIDKVYPTGSYSINDSGYTFSDYMLEPYDIDLCEILKDAPTGMKLYSTVYGDVHLQTIRPDDQMYPIRIRTKSYGNQAYSNNGRYYKDIGDVTLFPSYDNRDWESFKLPSKYEFEPLQKVLVRDNPNELWSLSFFSHKEGDSYVCCGVTWLECIPYENNENLLGTDKKYKK